MSKESTPSSSECDSSANNLKNDDSATIPKFLKKRHVKFLLRLLDVLPGSRFASLETSRMTMLFFVVSGLDVLGSLDKSINKDRRQELIEWIYSCQTQHGFVGSSFLKLGSDSVSYQKLNNSVHIAMTYTALATLAILGDDLSRINRSGISQGLKMLQKENGTFMASLEEDARDMRFVYCAASICRLLGNDFTGVNTESMQNYIMKSLTYEGAFAQGPDLEAHGGSTFCAVASLSLLGKLDQLDQDIKMKCVHWCSMRLLSGFQGRPNKQDDTCYTFWIGAALRLLSPDTALVTAQLDHCIPYILSTQDGITGGLAKWPNQSPDPLHTYLGLAGMALGSSISAELEPVDPALNITLRAKNYLDSIYDDDKKTK